ncbi:flippase-like domain-containing protein [Patescibacteria group bacterium]|nr:flippase-like domain-containing protein [Patescibacteria group bacterium]
MKKVILFLLSLSLGTYLSIEIYKAIGWTEVKNFIVNFTLQQGLIILALTILITLIGAFKWHEVLKGEGVSLPFFDTLKSYLAGYSIIFLAPALFLGGEFIRAYIIKQKNSVSWSKGTASIIIDMVLEFSINLIIIVIGLVVFLSKVFLLPANLTLLFGGLILFFIVVLSLFYIKVFKKESIVVSLGNLFKRDLNGAPQEVEKEIFSFFDIKNRALWITGALSLLRISIMYLRTFILIIFLKQQITAWYALSVLCFSLLALIVPIPAGAGAHELVQVFTFNSLGFSASSATAFAIIIRIVETIIALAGLVILSKLGINLLKNYLLKEENNRNK